MIGFIFPAQSSEHALPVAVVGITQVLLGWIFESGAQSMV